MLITAIGHLCENARQAMLSGGKLLIQTRNLDVDSTTYGDPAFDREWVEVSVHDTGTGMSAETLLHAVEPFVTTAGLAERLGLSMVYGFMTQSGGHMRLNSEPGKGTSVALRFPRFIQKTPIAPRILPSSSSQTILIVDSDESVRRSTSMLVQRMGYSTFTAQSAQEVLQVVVDNAVDVLMTDVPLGQGPDGLALARQLVSSIPHLGIVIMTGSGNVERANQTLPEQWQKLNAVNTIQAIVEAITRGEIST